MFLLISPIYEIAAPVATYFESSMRKKHGDVFTVATSGSEEYAQRSPVASQIQPVGATMKSERGFFLS